MVGRWRFGIDTEAYASGALTVLRLRGEQEELLKISAPARGGPAQTSRWEGSDVSYQTRRRTSAPDPAPAPRPAPASPKPARAGGRWICLLVLPAGVVGACAAAALAIAGAKNSGPSPVTQQRMTQGNALHIVQGNPDLTERAAAQAQRSDR